jgi:hypothetical protein
MSQGRLLTDGGFQIKGLWAMLTPDGDPVRSGDVLML